MIARILVKPFGTIWDLKDFYKKHEKSLIGRFAKFLYNWYQYEHGSAISCDSEFAGIPILPHGTKQIVITSDVRIGTNCTIFQQVSIQEDYLSSSPNDGPPVIGNNCYIYPGAKIIGKVTIGNDVIIGANVLVTNNVPDNSVLFISESKVQANAK